MKLRSLSSQYVHTIPSASRGTEMAKRRGPRFAGTRFMLFKKGLSTNCFSQMERLYQMHVVPDAVPDIRPSIDLHVIARTTPSVFLDSKKVQTHVVPGTFLRPKQVICAWSRSLIAQTNCASLKDFGPA
jgi:hypothetical protein